MSEITAVIRDHDADAGTLYDTQDQPIGTYIVHSRFRQQPGWYASILARINGDAYDGTKFERSRQGTVRLSPAPWRNDRDDSPLQPTLSQWISNELATEAQP